MGHLWCRPLGGCCVCSVVAESISINFMGRGNYSQEKTSVPPLVADGHYTTKMATMHHIHSLIQESLILRIYA